MDTRNEPSTLPPECISAYLMKSVIAWCLEWVKMVFFTWRNHVVYVERIMVNGKVCLSHHRLPGRY